MKRKLLVITTISLCVFIFMASSRAMYSSSVIDKVKPSDEDIPAGFVYGQIPGFAKNLLKSNPWNFDYDAIKKMTSRIYPGGEYSRVSGIHMTILAKQKNPFRDDIVCYVMIFRDKKSASEELTKLGELVNNNNDRSILLEKDNLAIYLFVDDVNNYQHIKDMSQNLQKKLDAI